MKRACCTLSADGTRFSALLYHPRCPCANPGGSVKLNKQQAIHVETVIASEAKQSSALQGKIGLLRRFAPRNDESLLE
jgi:hypothetical protein